jgi:hypothetical protein
MLASRSGNVKFSEIVVLPGGAVSISTVVEANKAIILHESVVTCSFGGALVAPHIFLGPQNQQQLAGCKMIGVVHYSTESNFCDAAAAIQVSYGYMPCERKTFTDGFFLFTGENIQINSVLAAESSIISFREGSSVSCGPQGNITASLILFGDRAEQHLEQCTIQGSHFFADEYPLFPSIYFITQQKYTHGAFGYIGDAGIIKIIDITEGTTFINTELEASTAIFVIGGNINCRAGTEMGVGGIGALVAPLIFLESEEDQRLEMCFISGQIFYHSDEASYEQALEDNAVSFSNKLLQPATLLVANDYPFLPLLFASDLMGEKKYISGAIGYFGGENIIKIVDITGGTTVINTELASSTAIIVQGGNIDCGGGMIGIGALRSPKIFLENEEDQELESCFTEGEIFYTSDEASYNEALAVLDTRSMRPPASISGGFMMVVSGTYLNVMARIEGFALIFNEAVVNCHTGGQLHATAILYGPMEDQNLESCLTSGLQLSTDTYCDNVEEVGLGAFHGMDFNLYTDGICPGV